MKKIKQLFDECNTRNLHCSITNQRITDYSIEIYKGYESSYEKVFYSGGHLKIKHAVRKGLGFFYKEEQENIKQNKCEHKRQQNGAGFMSCADCGKDLD